MGETSSTSDIVRAVVHPTDLTAPSDIAFAHALKIAIARRAKFYILHSQLPTSDDFDWEGFPSVRKVLADWKLLEAGSSQADVAAKLGVHVAKVEIHRRNAVKGILGFLDTHDSDLLVLATHGREGLSRWLHGSVAEPIARQADLNTLFVREGGRGFVDPSNGEVRLRRVLVPVDHKPRPEAAIDAAWKLARLLGSEIDMRLVHVKGDADMAAMHGLPDGAELSVREGDVVDEILGAARDGDVDLIAMSTSGHEGFLDALRGSTSERVLRQAPCPVLTVPAR